jgi:serine/threonine-protein kinase RsbW
MTFLRPARPPSGSVEVRQWTLDTAAELSVLRRSLHEALANGSAYGGGELQDVPEKVVLVASELATNALRHGLPPTEVRLLRADDDRFVLDVADREPGVPPESTAEDLMQEGGRGLEIARRLALDVGWYATESTKHVWAAFKG